MLIEVLKCKLHRVTVTEADLHYIGSITLDSDLMDAAGIVDNEKVQVLNIQNGERLETYAIRGAAGSGVVSMNGPAARLVQRGDIVIVCAYAQMSPEEAAQHHPTVVFPDTATNSLR